MVGLLPLVPVTIYMLGQRYATGMWLPNPWMPQNEIKTVPLVPAMLLFLGGRHWLLSGALLVGLVATPRRFRRTELLLIGGMFALFIIGLTPECNLRYLMPAITLLAVLAAYALREVFGDRAKARLGATALLVATCWLPWPMLGSGNMNPPDASMRYVDVLRVRQDVMEHLLEHHQAELGVLVLSELWHMLLPPERTIQLLDIKWLEDEAGLDFAVELPHITDASTQELQQIVARRSFQPCVRFQHGPEHGAVWCESHEANQQLTPARLERRLLQAGILTEQGRFDEALAACDRLLAEPLTPEQRVAALQQAATVLSKDNRFEAAAERLSHALRILPNDAQMHLDLGMARLAQQDLASAVAALDQAVALAPDWSHAHLQLGFVRMLQRRLPEAERHLLQAATLGDPQPDADYYLGALYVEQGDFAEAVEHLTRAAEQITDRGRLYYYLAVARGQLGEIDAAWTAIERAVALAPDDAEAAQYREQLARRRAAPASDRGE